MAKKAFECKMCGQCCYGEGGIYLEQSEAKRISSFLDLSVKQFMEEYCEEKNGTIYLRTAKSGYCIFYDEKKACLIHPVKPFRCLQWPFYPANVQDPDAWDLAKDACPGINRNCSFEDFVKQGKAHLSSFGRDRPAHVPSPPQADDSSYASHPLQGEDLSNVSPPRGGDGSSHVSTPLRAENPSHVLPPLMAEDPSHIPPPLQAEDSLHTSPPRGGRDSSYISTPLRAGDPLHVSPPLGEGIKGRGSQ